MIGAIPPRQRIGLVGLLASAVGILSQQRYAVWGGAALMLLALLLRFRRRNS